MSVYVHSAEEILDQADADISVMLTQRTGHPLKEWRLALMMLDDTPGGVRIHLPTVLELMDMLLVGPVEAVLAVRGSLEVH